MENKIYKALNNIKGNTILGITYFSDVRMNKGGRACTNPLWGHKVVRVTTTEFQFGNVYENSVNNRSDKESGVRVFETEAPKGKVWEKFPYFLKNLDGSKTYVRFYKMRNVKGSSFILVDGHLMTEDEMAIIKEYEQKKTYTSQKQSEAGLTENQVEVRDINIDNILRIVLKGDEIVNTIAEETIKVGA